MRTFGPQYRLEARLPTEAHYAVIEPGPDGVGKQNKTLVLQAGQWQGARLGLGMAGRQGDQQRLLLDKVMGKALATPAWQPQDGGIQPIVAQRLHQCRHGAFLRAESHLGVALPIVVQQGQHRGVEHGGPGKADPQRPLLAPGNPLYLQFCRIGQRQDLRRIPIEALARLGQFDTAGQTAQ